MWVSGNRLAVAGDSGPEAIMSVPVSAMAANTPVTPMASVSLAAPARKVIPASQLLFGTDFPYRTSREHALGLLQCGFNEDELTAIEYGNARRLLPGLRVAGRQPHKA